MSMYIPEIVEEVSENAKFLMEDGGKIVRVGDHPKGGNGGNDGNQTQHEIELLSDGFTIDGEKIDCSVSGDSTFYNIQGNMSKLTKEIFSNAIIKYSNGSIYSYGKVINHNETDMAGAGKVVTTCSYCRGTTIKSIYFMSYGLD